MTEPSVSTGLRRAVLIVARLNLGYFRLVTARLWHAVWPDVIVGIAIAAITVDAARKVWQAARGEREAEASNAKTWSVSRKVETAFRHGRATKQRESGTAIEAKFDPL